MDVEITVGTEIMLALGASIPSRGAHTIFNLGYASIDRGSLDLLISDTLLFKR